jgi:AcrR family transcriptional regulator
MSATRPLRADAERNRRRILDAARIVFAREGAEACVDAVAREAGVGMGTLYRRFPTKERLLDEVIADRVEAALETVAHARAIDDPREALEAAMHGLTELFLHNRALLDAMGDRLADTPQGRARRRELLDAVEPLVTRARDAGALREDVVAGDLTALVGLLARLPGWRLRDEPRLWERYLAIALDGLRPEGAHALPHPPPRPPAGRGPGPSNVRRPEGWQRGRMRRS